MFFPRHNGLNPSLKMPKYVFPLDPGMAEYVFAPFFDYEHSPSIPIEIDPSSTATVIRETEWCWTKVVWSNGRPNDVAVMCRCFAPFDADHHDQVVAAVAVPKGATVEFALIAANGGILGNWSKPFAGTGIRQEVVLGIRSMLASIKSPRALARLIGLRPLAFGGVAIRVSSSVSDPGVLTLSWLGLRNSDAYAMLHRPQMRSLPDWSSWILDRRLWAEIAPQHGLLFGKEEIQQVRVKKDLPAWKEHFALLEDRARQFLERVPEDDLGDYLPNHDMRFTRAREVPARAWHWEALVLAFVGLVNDDEKMIGHALRYLMCMIHTQNWADSAEQRIPSSTWNQRSFLEEMTTTSVAILVDWLGFALTPQAKSLARQALWTRGMAPVQRDLFQFDYMHKMNQGAVFCRALIMGGLTLEREWPRARKVADEAFQTMKTVLTGYIKSDGGMSEGPGYLCQTMTAALWAIIAYSRARGLDWREEAKQLFGSVESYVRVMAASRPGQCVPSGDCRLEWFSGDPIPMFAALFPDSAYADILMECLTNGWVHELTGTLRGSGGMVGMVYGPDVVKPSRGIAAPSLWLPESGKCSRIKSIYGRQVRLWVTTSMFGATHSHLDHGGFVLEIDEKPVFVDRGMAEYWKTDVTHLMKRSCFHNVLTPILQDGTYADQGTPPAPWSKDELTGSPSTALHVPGQGVWPDAMLAYERIFDMSDAAGSGFVVRDSGQLLTRGRVAFHLHTRYPFNRNGNRVEAEVAGVLCSVSFPWAKEVIVEKSIPDFAGREIWHVCAISEETIAFDLETAISVSPLAGAPH